MGASSGYDMYSVPGLAQLLHSAPHLNITLDYVDDTFDYNSPVYVESLVILSSLPAAWLILTLLLLLIYLLTRCCDRKPRPSRSISTLKRTLAGVSVLCCACVGLGLYGNDDLHNGISQLLEECKQINDVVSKIRSQTEQMERQLRVQADLQLTSIHDIFDQHVSNVTLYKEAKVHLERAIANNTNAVEAAMEIREPLKLNLTETIKIGENFEMWRWPITMGVLSVLLVLCVILLVGVARHNRCALIMFSVCGLLAIIASFVMASVYVASSVALGDICMAPNKLVEGQAATELSKEILHYYYMSCEKARANPFTLRLREAKTTIENIRYNLQKLKMPAIHLFPKKGLDTKFSSLKNEVNSADSLVTSITGIIDCGSLHTHYMRGVRATCLVGLSGLTMMLISAILTGLLLSILVLVDSHTWIYIRKKKDYQHSNETDPFLPPPQASQAIAARTLQRSQGSSYPPDTPPPSYSSALMHNRAHASAPPLHEAQLPLDGCDMRSAEQMRGGAHMSHLRGHTLGRLPSHHDPSLAGPNNGKAACKEFPNFKGFKFDQRQQQQQQRNVHHPQQHQEIQRTANIQKFSTLGRRPLPQTPDEKARKQPPVPKVPMTISQNVETPLNPANFRSLQRGAWQDGTSSFQPNVQFRSLQRGVSVQQPAHSQFRSAKIQDQMHNEAVYANNENERQLYAVTEL